MTLRVQPRGRARGHTIGIAPPAGLATAAWTAGGRAWLPAPIPGAQGDRPAERVSAAAPMLAPRSRPALLQAGSFRGAHARRARWQGPVPSRHGGEMPPSWRSNPAAPTRCRAARARAPGPEVPLRCRRPASAREAEGEATAALSSTWRTTSSLRVARAVSRYLRFQRVNMSRYVFSRSRSPGRAGRPRSKRPAASRSDGASAGNTAPAGMGPHARRPAICSARWQATRPCESLRNSGVSCRQRSIAKPQRAEKAHPGGGFSGEGRLSPPAVRACGSARSAGRESARLQSAPGCRDAWAERRDVHFGQFPSPGPGTSPPPGG